MEKIRTKGSALISALFIMTLVAIAATAMTLRMHLDIYRTQLTIRSDQRYLASQAVIFWAMDKLSSKKYPFSKLYPQGQLADFPANLQNIYPGFTLSGKIFDLQAKFNLNNLSDKVYVAKFRSLIDRVLVKKSPAQREALIKSILYWISPYDIDQGIDSELSIYLKQSPPYYPSHQPFKSLSELRLINGVDANIYQTLSPFLTVLPENTEININTAAKNLLFTIKTEITEEQVQGILQERTEGIKDNNALNAMLNKFNLGGSAVIIESAYFLVVAEVKNEDYTLINSSILKREIDKNGKVAVYLIEEGWI